MLQQLSGLVRNPFDSLRSRLAVLFAVVLLPPTALSLYLGWSAFEEQSEKARLSVRQFASLVSAYERDFFRDTQRLMTNLTADPQIQRMLPGDCGPALDRALKNFPEYMSISATDPDGTVICTTATAGEAVNLAFRSWFQEVLDSRGFTISDYTVSQDLAEPVIVAASPILGEGNQVKGVLHIDIDLDWLSLFIRLSGVPAEGTVFLLDKHGTILASPEHNFGPSEAGLPDQATLQRVVDRRLTDFEAIGNDGQKRVYSSVALPHGNVLVLFGLPSATTLGSIERDLFTRTASLVIIWLAGIFAAVVGTRLWVTQWISQLRRTARAYSRGDFSTRVNFEAAPVELRDFGATLGNMAKQIQAREEDLRASLEQKDTLLKEIHHRVKNNLQTIASLLNIRMRSAKNEEAYEALKEVRTRVRALGLVHHYLYESDDVRFVELNLFIGELCQVLYDTLSGSDRRIRIESEVERLTIASDRVVPIALLITEAVTNAFKHAYPQGGPGKIRVALRRLDGANAMLTVSDDGIGYGADRPIETAVTADQGVGMSLISAFTRQLGSDLRVSGPPGTTLSLKVRLQSRGSAAAAPSVAEEAVPDEPAAAEAPSEDAATPTGTAGLAVAGGS